MNIQKNLQNIKCIIVDFDCTLYNDADLSQMNQFYAEFLFEHNLIEKSDDVLSTLKTQYPNFHMVQCIFYLARQNGIDDEYIKQWLDNNIYNIMSENIKIVDKDLIEKLCKKYPIYILSDSGQEYLKHYIKEFEYNYNWFAGVISNDYKSEDMGKSDLIKQIQKSHKLNNDEIIMIGDSQISDIMAADKAGILSCLVKSVDDTENIFSQLLKIGG